MNETEHLLTILGEECAEVAQRASKAARFGLAEVQPGQAEDNRRRLERELADLMATAELLGLVVREEDKVAKLEKLKKFMAYARQIGTLDMEGAYRKALEEIGGASLVASTLGFLRRKIEEAVAPVLPTLLAKAICGNPNHQGTKLCSLDPKHDGRHQHGEETWI